MKRMYQLLFTSIYTKLVVAFLLVITPLYGLSLLMNIWGQKIVTEDVSETMSSKVHFYLGTLDDEFSRILRIQKGYVTDKDLVELSLISEHMSDYERVDAINRVYKKMQLIAYSSNYIVNANASIFSINKTISSVQTTSAINHEKLDALKEENYLSISVWDDRLFISTFYPTAFPSMPGNEPSFILDIEISKRMIENVLATFKIEDYGNTMLYHDDGKFVLYGSKENPKLNASIQNFIQKKLDKGILKGLETIKIGEQNYIVSFEKSTSTNSTLIMYLPEQKILRELRNYNRWFWILAGISIIIIGLFSYWIYRLIHQPLKKLVEAFRAVEAGNLTVNINNNRNDEFTYLYKQFNSMTYRLNHLITEVYEQKFRAQRAELKHLQSQVNPHFLYNSFFILNRMVKKQDYNNLLPFSKSLGEYFKYINRDGRDDVSLKLEVNYAKAYVAIQSFRFSNRIHVNFENLPEQCEELLVPRLILQPIIENAYEHGLEDKVSNGEIHITFEVLESFLIIKVADNGRGLESNECWQLQNLLTEKEEALENTGLINIHHRLRLKFGDCSRVTVQNSQSGGLVVQLFIPLRGSCKDE